MRRLPKAYYEDRGFKTRAQLRASSSQIIVSSSIEESLEHNQVSDVQHAIETVDAEKDQSLVQHLDFATWLPFAAKVYNISPHIEDYILVSTVICPSEIPNRNGIAFPTSELAKFQPPPMNRMVYKAWTGCPIHSEHDNEVHERAYGVIFDSSFHKVQGYGGGKLWKVMGLNGIDKQKYPDMAQRVLNKEVNTYSMGALVDYFQCGYCGAECHSKFVCPHIKSIQDVNWDVHRDWEGNSHLSFLNAFGISPIECSIVEDPAWAPALSDTVFEMDESVRPWDQGKEVPDVRRAVERENAIDKMGRSIFDQFPMKW